MCQPASVLHSSEMICLVSILFCITLMNSGIPRNFVGGGGGGARLGTERGGFGGGLGLWGGGGCLKLFPPPLSMPLLMNVHILGQ